MSENRQGFKISAQENAILVQGKLLEVNNILQPHNNIDIELIFGLIFYDYCSLNL